MAYIGDSDESFEHIVPGKDDSYLEEVIQNALLESDDESPQTSEEFWKPIHDRQVVGDRNDMNGRQSDADIYVDSERDKSGMDRNFDHKNVKNVYDSFENDIHGIYRSQSDDNISTKIKEDYTGTNENVATRSEMGSKEFMKYNIKDINPQSPPVSLISDQEVSPEGGSEQDSQGVSIDFFYEYERRIDMLEYCDYALEQAFVKLSEGIKQLYPGNQEVCTESKDENGVDTLHKTENDDKSIDSVTNGRDNGKDENVDSQRQSSKEKSFDKCDDKASDKASVGNGKVAPDLRESMTDLESRFEEFVTEVGDIIQLGALAAKHAMRVEKWASQMQTMYTSIKSDHHNMQVYLEDKERQSMHERQQLQMEMSNQEEHIRLLMEELLGKEGNLKEKQNLYKKIGERYIRKPVNPNKPRSGEALVEALLNCRYSEEQSIALDFARQSKISELKLVILQQQSYIQKLELQNKEMDGVLQGVLFRHDLDEPEEPPQEYQLRHLRPLTEALSQVSDVLYCDHTQYLPGKSTDPQVVAEQVFEIGEGNFTEQRDKETVFVPQQLGYIKEGIRRDLSNKTVEVTEQGSGECNTVTMVDRSTAIDKMLSQTQELQQNQNADEEREESSATPEDGGPYDNETDDQKQINGCGVIKSRAHGTQTDSLSDGIHKVVPQNLTEMTKRVLENGKYVTVDDNVVN